MELDVSKKDKIILTDAMLSAPLKILGPTTHAALSALCDGNKILLSPKSLHRDWRGLAEVARLDVLSISSNSRISHTSHCLHLWGQAGGTVQRLISALQDMDRHDVICDAQQHIANDYEKLARDGYPSLPVTLEEQESIHTFADDVILTVHDRDNLMKGGTLSHYDALLLHADEDNEFAYTAIQKLEGEYGLKLCVKDRDLIGGLQFESASIVRLIKERCYRVIVLLSNAFLESPQNKFFTYFAHALSIDERRRIVIPCQIERCERPNIISYCHTLDYFRAQGYWDFWKKLRDSVLPGPAIVSPSSPSSILELPNSKSLFASASNNNNAIVTQATQSAVYKEDGCSKPSGQSQKCNGRVRSVSSGAGILNKLLHIKRRDTSGKRSASESQCSSVQSSASYLLDSTTQTCSSTQFLLPDVPPSSPGSAGVDASNAHHTQIQSHNSNKSTSARVLKMLKPKKKKKSKVPVVE